VNLNAIETNFDAGMGRANESIARRQESYVANATTTWLESLERSLAQMKEYQVGLIVRLFTHRYSSIMIGSSQEAGSTTARL
jgi:hypothetical protein